MQTSSFTGLTVEVQTEQALKNLGVYGADPTRGLFRISLRRSILRAGGSDFHKVLKTTILLRNMNDFPQVNAVYAKCTRDISHRSSHSPRFPKGPARESDVRCCRASEGCVACVVSDLTTPG